MKTRRLRAIIRYMFKRKRNRTAVVVIAVCAVALRIAWYCEEPAYYLFLCRFLGDRAGREQAERDLVSTGQRAIGPLISNAETQRLGNAFGARVLAKLGGPAHEALLQEIDRSNLPYSRVNVVALLQDSFNDFSRITIWLDFIRDNSKNGKGSDASRVLESDLETHFQLEPQFITDQSGQFTKEFVNWYQTHVSSGAFPKYDFGVSSHRLVLHLRITHRRLLGGLL